MSSTKVPLNKIVIGTASWGSKINYANSLIIAKELVNLGINNFDTAPNYGAGYSQSILNKLGKNYKINVNSKFGQRVKFNLYEIAKRVYRYNNFKSFINSNLNLFNYTFRNNKFWLNENIKKNLLNIKKELFNCNLDIFFLHSPNKNFSKKTFNEFKIICSLNNLRPGISNIEDDFVEYMLSKEQKVILQMPLRQYFKFEKKINLNKYEVQINTIFKSKNEQRKFSINSYTNDVFKYFQNKKNIKLIIGINSSDSLYKLKENII